MRFWSQIWRDISWASEQIGKVDAVIKILTAVVAFLIAGFGLGALLGTNWYAIFSGLSALLLSFYFGSVFARSRRPKLVVGPLEADLRPDSLQFHIQVKNEGPGRLRPKVTITELTDGNGVPLMAGYSGWEAHWRSVPQGERPLLNEGDRKYVGILYVRYGNRSENPRLWSFPIDHQMQALWSQGQEPKNGLRITFTVTSESEKGDDSTLQDERTYHFWPDSNEPLGYSFKRVRLPNWRIKHQATALPKNEPPSLTS